MSKQASEPFVEATLDGNTLGHKWDAQSGSANRAAPWDVSGRTHHPVRFRGAGLATALIGGTILSLSVSSVALAETADQIFTQHRKALGGDAALAKLTSTVQKGALSAGPLSGTFTWSTLSPLSFREDADLAGLTRAAGSSGRSAWVLEQNSVLSRPSGTALDQLQAMNLLLGMGYLSPADFELEAGEPQKSPDGKQWVLPLSGPQMPGIVLRFDASSWLLTGAEVKARAGDASWSFVLGGHKKFGGLSFPTTLERTFTHGSYTESVKYAVSSVERATELEEARFERPTEVGRSPVFPAGQTKVSLPMTYLPSQRAVGVMATVQGGSPQLFLLDSTRTFSVLDAALAASLNLPAAGSMRNDETGAAVPLVKLEKLSLEGVALPPTVMQTADLKNLTAVLGKPVAGVLGLEVFEHLVVEVRYSDARVDLHAPGSYTDRGTGEALPLDESGRVNVLVNGQTMVSALLSTRQSLAFLAPRALLERENLLPAAGKRMTPELAGVSGDGPGFVGAFATLQLGNASLQNVVTYFPDKDPYLPGGSATLGNALLEHFHVTFDRGRRQVVVEANPWYTRSFGYNRTGVQLKAGPILEVVHVQPGAEGGLEPGDMVTGVQVKGAWTTDLKAIEEAIFANEVSRLKVKVKRGKKEVEKELVLKDLL